MKRWKVTLLLIFIFLAGATTGSIVTRLMIKKRNFRMFSQVQEQDLTPMANKIFSRLDKRLKFEPGQEEAVRATIEKFLRDVSELRQQHRPKMAAIFEKSTTELKSVLNETQAKELERIMQKLREQRAQNRED
jgi:DNA-directed RNA polymerase subunit F